jgi:hypothetical protein
MPIPKTYAATDITPALLEITEQIRQLAEGQQSLANAVSEQHMVLSSLIQHPPARQAGDEMAELPAYAPGTGIQPFQPTLPVPPPWPMGPGMLPQPAMPAPLIRRDIQRVLLHDPLGEDTELETTEVTSSFDLDTLTETNEVNKHRYTNLYGEPLDAQRPLSGCFFCHEKTHEAKRCRVCDIPLCHAHAVPMVYGEGEDRRIEFLCETHAPRPPFNLLEAIAWFFSLGNK